jgi:hypothetical protein
MDQERFDELAKKVFDTSSRRRVLGGAIAGILGASAAKVADVAGKGKGKGKGKGAGAEHKKGKGKGAGAEHHNGKGKGAGAEHHNGKGKGAGKDSVCAGNNNAGGCPAGTCCLPDANPNDTCVTLQTQQNLGNVKRDGPCGDVAGNNRRCRICPPGTYCTGDNGNNNDTTNRKCKCDNVSCPVGCCQAIGNGNYVCITTNGAGAVQENGNIYCVPPGPNRATLNQSTCNNVNESGGTNGCCDDTGHGRPGNTPEQCGSAGRICQNCRLTDPTAQCTGQTCPGVTTTTTAAAAVAK